MYLIPEEASFDIATDSAGDHVIALRGDWDLGNVALIREAFARLAATDSGLICVDLCPTRFMDSTALHELLQLRRLVGPRMSVRCTTGPVLRILRLAGLIDYLSVSIP